MAVPWRLEDCAWKSINSFVEQSEGRGAPHGAGLLKILYGNEKRVVKAPQ